VPSPASTTLGAMPPWRRHRDAGSTVLAGAASAAAAEVEAALAVPEDPGAAAFFDVDNTMMQGASIYLMAKGLVQHGFFTGRDLRRFAWQQVKFRFGGSEDLDHMSSVREAALQFIAGHRVDDVVAVGEEIWEDVMADKIWPGTQALAQMHLDAGQRVWLVTATPVEIATLIAKRLGLTGALGTVSEVEDGCYTGRLVGEVLHGPAKAQAVTALATQEGLDLSRCSAYSDSANDVPMLSLVGHPCAVNPDGALARHAKQQGWQVRDYRTGRKAARIGLPAAAGVGAAAGGVVAGLAVRRRSRRWPPF
jgi:HAD superfamily hydrolase (TIGR01490 family)